MPAELPMSAGWLGGVNIPENLRELGLVPEKVDLVIQLSSASMYHGQHLMSCIGHLQSSGTGFNAACSTNSQ